MFKSYAGVGRILLARHCYKSRVNGGTINPCRPLSVTVIQEKNEVEGGMGQAYL